MKWERQYSTFVKYVLQVEHADATADRNTVIPEKMNYLILNAINTAQIVLEAS